MINYSLVLRNSIPGEPSEKKVYAMAQSESKMSLREFSKHIADHGSVYDRSTVEGVLTKAVECMREQLLLGRIVELGDLGCFSISLSSNPAPNATEFTAKNIKAVRARWSPGMDFRNLLEDAEFQFVTSRKAQAAARLEQKATLDAESGYVPEGGGGPNTDDSNGE